MIKLILKKSISILIFISLIIINLSCCTGDSVKTVKPLEINDSNFYEYFLIMNTNPSEIIGKKVSIEGKSYISEYNGKTYYLVTRCIDGICLEHEWEMIGFEFITENNETILNNEWINIQGTVSSYEEDGFTYYYVLADNIIVMQKEGDYYLHNEQ